MNPFGKAGRLGWRAGAATSALFMLLGMSLGWMACGSGEDPGEQGMAPPGAASAFADARVDGRERGGVEELEHREVDGVGGEPFHRPAGVLQVGEGRDDGRGRRGSGSQAERDLGDHAHRQLLPRLQEHRRPGC